MWHRWCLDPVAGALRLSRDAVGFNQRWSGCFVPFTSEGPVIVQEL